MPIDRSVLSRMVCPAPVASAAWPVVVDQRPRRRVRGRSRTPARRPARSRPDPSRHSTVRTSRCSASSSAGGRVCGVTVSGPCRGPIVRASWTSTQPPRRVPGGGHDVRAGHVGARGGHVDAERAEPERAGAAVEQVPERARRVEGGHAQPVDRAVRRDQRPGVAVRQERVVGDRRERRCRGAHVPASFGLHDPGPCQPPWSATSVVAVAGPQLPGAYGCTGGGSSSSGCMIRQVSSTPSCRVNRRAVADASRRAAAPRTASGPRRPRRRTPCRGDRPRPRPRRPGGRPPSSRTPVDGSSLITIWSGSGRRSSPAPKPEPRRALEHQPQLGLGRPAAACRSG